MAMTAAIDPSIWGTDIERHVAMAEMAKRFVEQKAERFKPGSSYTVKTIANGYLVDFHNGTATESHYAADEKAVGELVTATLVRFLLQGGSHDK